MRLHRPAHCCSQRPRLQRQRLLLPPVLAPAFAARPAATASRHSPFAPPLQHDATARAGRPRSDGAAAVEPPPQQEDQDEEQLDEPFVGSTRTPRDPKLTAPLVLERGAPEVPYVRLSALFADVAAGSSKSVATRTHTGRPARHDRSNSSPASRIAPAAQPGEYQQTLVASFTLGGVGLHTGQDGAWRAAP